MDAAAGRRPPAEPDAARAMVAAAGLLKWRGCVGSAGDAGATVSRDLEKFQ